MWKKNRPEGWKNPYPEYNELQPHLRNIGYLAFEAGADAMLEGLRKGATKVNNIGDLPQGKGVIVFIPD